MKITTIIGLLLLGLYDASGQSSNRTKIIEMVLKKHQPLREQINHTYPYCGGVYTVTVKKAAKTEFISFSEPIPRFQLPHGAIVCRFEEYVQLHSPFKLNIGVGGE